MNPLHGTRELLAPSYGLQSARNWSIHFDLNLFLARAIINRMEPLVSNIKEGETVSVDCYASGIPAPDYFWKFLKNISGKQTYQVAVIPCKHWDISGKTTCMPSGKQTYRVPDITDKRK